MKKLIILIIMLTLIGCNKATPDKPYEVYYQDQFLIRIDETREAEYKADMFCVKLTHRDITSWSCYDPKDIELRPIEIAS